MELKELCEKSIEIFEIKNISELSDKLLDVCMNNQHEYMERFAETVGDLSVDWLQKIFQYYEADRKEKMQDYTPLSLARFVGKLTETGEEKAVYYLNNEENRYLAELRDALLPDLMSGKINLELEEYH